MKGSATRSSSVSLHCPRHYLRAVCGGHTACLFDSRTWWTRLLDHSLQTLGGEAGSKTTDRKVDYMGSAHMQDAYRCRRGHDSLRVLEKPESCRQLLLRLVLSSSPISGALRCGPLAVGHGKRARRLSLRTSSYFAGATWSWLSSSWVPSSRKP